MINVEALQAFYLEAGDETYAANAPKIKLPELPGQKILKYERGPYLYLDIWCSSGSASYGQTTINLEGQPVWTMQYGGLWEGNDPEIIPFLKRALLAEKGFNGGRGPREYSEGGDLTYRNDVRQPCFALFSGVEFIERKGIPISVFWHDYHGRLLVPVR